VRAGGSLFFLLPEAALTVLAVVSCPPSWKQILVFALLWPLPLLVHFAPPLPLSKFVGALVRSFLRDWEVTFGGDGDLV